MDPVTSFKMADDIKPNLAAIRVIWANHSQMSL